MLRPIGYVESPLDDSESAPRQGHEGSPEAWLMFNDDMSDGLRDLTIGSDVLVLTWLDKAPREVLLVHPRGNPEVPKRGVFSTRSPARPNPLGVHRVGILDIEGIRVKVSDMEAINGTPILDVKSVLGPNDH